MKKIPLSFFTLQVQDLEISMALFAHLVENILKLCDAWYLYPFGAETELYTDIYVSYRLLSKIESQWWEIIKKMLI